LAKVLLYGDVVWWATVPWREVQQAVGLAGLHFRQPFPWRMLLTAGLGGSTLLLMGVGIFFIHGASLGAILGVLGVSVPLGVLGWFAGGVIEWQESGPIYTFRTYWREADEKAGVEAGRVFEPMYYEDCNIVLTDQERGYIGSVISTIVRQAADQMGAKVEQSAESQLRVTPLFTTQGIYHYQRMTDERKVLSGRGDKWAKAQLTSLIMSCVSIIAIVALLFVATMQQEPAPGDTFPKTTEEQRQGVSDATR
jgi:hypothetical protein